ncbi:MAG: type II toxin-antitoxin system VapC family toxin [Actinomycetota bacterium]|nr:type II toxin-antitoxin system VapC family toxin [Actinomycetota bacterium]
MASELRPIEIEIIGDDPAPLPEAQGGELVLYLDTSALVQLYVEQEHSDAVARAVAGGVEVNVSQIVDLEARAAFARLLHEGELSAGDVERVLGLLAEDLGRVRVIPYGPDLARAAGALALKHSSPPLRAYDALHLASALEAFRSARGLSGYDCRFLAFDRRLVAAARAEGLRLYLDPYANR